jgi:DNA-binding phage protein
MAKRSQDWNKVLSRDLHDPKFAREFLIVAIEEGVPLQAALSKAIKAYCVAEFAKNLKIASPNMLRAVNTKHNPTKETLNELLMPFGLKLTVAPITAIRHRKAS